MDASEEPLPPVIYTMENKPIVTCAGDQNLFTSVYPTLSQQLPREPMEWRRTKKADVHKDRERRRQQRQGDVAMFLGERETGGGIERKLRKFVSCGSLRGGEFLTRDKSARSGKAWVKAGRGLGVGRGVDRDT
ncbi:hypothetical protein H8959_003444 [Pygathrix nigripes]